MDHKRRLFTTRTMLTAFGAGFAALVVVLIMANAISGPKTEPQTDTEDPKVLQEPLEPTDLDHIKNVLGPFETIAVDANSPTPETQSPAVLILNQDHSTLASQDWTVPFDADAWERDNNTPKIRSKTVEMDFMTIKTDRDLIFVVKALQPFIFEETPDTVYVIDSEGQIWSITSARAVNSRKAL